MSQNDLHPQLARLAAGETLDRAEMAAAMEILMSGAADPAQAGALLMGLNLKGETAEELAGAASVLRAKAATLQAPKGAIDTCGTGGDGHGTYNISTAVSFVVAACDVPVAKHGNRAASSKSGAADVLEALGLNLSAPLPQVESALREIGIAFLMAPNHHAAMHHVAPIRQSLKIRTLFNLLGPLANPAGAKRQLLGVYDARWCEPLAWCLEALGSEAAWVVHGADGLDELSISGASLVYELKGGQVHGFEITPEDAGLSRHPLSALKGGAAAENAAALRALLEGEKGAYRDIVLLNTAAALIVAGRVLSLREGVKLAAQAIDSGAALARLDTLIAHMKEPV